MNSISVNFTSYPLEDRGRFRCSDDLLNRIWDTGANTLRLCMHDGYEDCPSRAEFNTLAPDLITVACAS